MDLFNVWNWIKKLKLSDRQIAMNGTESALFSILNICREGYVSPTQLIWISSALEALYDTLKGQISRTLVDRIELFLGIPENGKKKFKKKIREFYNLRSRFVHGELEIAHPMYKNILDEKFSDYETQLLENCDFGLSIVIATLQKMIKNKWTCINFKEQYFGN